MKPLTKMPRADRIPEHRPGVPRWALTALLAGALLMLFAFALFVADIKAPTHGILTAGGLVNENGAAVPGSATNTTRQRSRSRKARIRVTGALSSPGSDGEPQAPRP